MNAPAANMGQICGFDSNNDPIYSQLGCFALTI
jgi:hypothetical protein